MNVCERRKLFENLFGNLRISEISQISKTLKIKVFKSCAMASFTASTPPTPNEIRFELACSLVTSHNPPQNIQLELYSLYKFATKGPLDPSVVKKPSMFDFTGRAKWNAYNEATTEFSKQVGTSEEKIIVAMSRYIIVVEGVIGRAVDVDEEPPSSSSSSNSPNSSSTPPPATGMMGPVSSTLIEETLSASSLNTTDHRKFPPLSDPSKNLHNACINYTDISSLSSLSAILSSSPSPKVVMERDELGQTALHLLMDEGTEDAILCLSLLVKTEVLDAVANGFKHEIEIELSSATTDSRWISPISQDDFDGVSPLLAALGANRSLPIIQTLVNVAGAVTTTITRNDCAKGEEGEEIWNFIRNS